jgi:3-dehydroquinate synthase
MPSTVSIASKGNPSKYNIEIHPGILSDAGTQIASVAEHKHSRVAVISNKKVFDLYGSRLLDSLEAAGIDAITCLIGDGERFKNLRTLEKTLLFLNKHGIKRTDMVVAFGGGVVGDLAGFAASIHLRGIPFVQVPTTLLSMIDSSVGGKTGVNTSFGKNLVGTFYQPAKVLIDQQLLSTLPKREVTAGFCEAVKQGAIGGIPLLKKVSTVLEMDGRDARYATAMEQMLDSQVRFKASIVRLDEREAVDKTDGNSRKILNFGHTFAHALEKLTNYRYFKHGEAVGHGILFAAALSKKLELISDHEVELLNDVVHRCGVLPPIRDIDPSAVLEAFKYDKKNVGNSVQWVLLRGIGNPTVVSQHVIPKPALVEVIRKAVRG